MEAAEKFFHTVGIETYNCMNQREAIESLTEVKAVIVSENSSLVSDEEFIATLQEQTTIPILLVKNGATLKITRFKPGESPSSIHCSNMLKKTDAETWKVIWQEIQKLIT